MHELISHSVVFDAVRLHGLYPAWLISPGKNTGMGSHALLQEIFSTQGSNPGLPQCRQILYHLRHQGSTVALLVMAKNWKKILRQLMNE